MQRVEAVDAIEPWNADILYFTTRARLAFTHRKHAYLNYIYIHTVNTQHHKNNSKLPSSRDRLCLPSSRHRLCLHFSANVNMRRVNSRCHLLVLVTRLVETGAKR